MNDYIFMCYLEELKEGSDNEFVLNTVCFNNNDKMYYYGFTTNVGFITESKGFESLEELYNEWYIMEVLKND